MQPNISPTESHIKVSVVAGAVLRRDNTYLLLEQAKESAKGQWGLPAGKIQVGETAQQAAIREAKEECGYDVKLIQELGVYHPRLTGPVKHIFLAEVVGGEEKLDPTEIASAAWLTLDEVEERKDKMRDSSIYTALVAAANATPQAPNTATAAQVVVGARYMHYKQLSYKVLALALREEDNEPCVVYQAEYGNKIIWIRPVSSWVEEVEVKGEKVKRFTNL